MIAMYMSGMYSEFQENILYRPSIIDPNDLLIFILFGENVFTIDFVLAKVDTFEGGILQRLDNKGN